MFDVYKEMCGVSLKAYVIAQLMHMILKVNEEGKMLCCDVDGSAIS